MLRREEPVEPGPAPLEYKESSSPVEVMGYQLALRSSTSRILFTSSSLKTSSPSSTRSLE